MNISLPFEFGERLYYIKKYSPSRGYGSYVIEDGCLHGLNISYRKKEMYIQFQIKSENRIGINNLFRTKEEAKARLNALNNGDANEEGIPHTIASCFRKS
ncbi:MAG TPA: hypothetical protein VF941_04210 [Clostridia bacterium]